MNVSLQERPQAQTAVRPVAVPVEYRETATEIEVRAMVPGVDPQNLNVEVTRNSVTLSGNAIYGHFQYPRRRDNILYTQLQTRPFRRIVRLRTEIDNQNVRSQLKDGVLTLTLPKQQIPAPFKVSLADPQAVERETADNTPVKPPVEAPQTEADDDRELTEDLWADDTHTVL